MGAVASLATTGSAYSQLPPRAKHEVAARRHPNYRNEDRPGTFGREINCLSSRSRAGEPTLRRQRARAASRALEVAASRAQTRTDRGLMRGTSAFVQWRGRPVSVTEIQRMRRPSKARPRQRDSARSGRGRLRPGPRLLVRRQVRRRRAGPAAPRPV